MGKLNIELSPQISIIQAPILELEGYFAQAIQSNYSREKITTLLMEFGPFIRRDWLPIVDYFPSSRTKFSLIDDRLLLLGLKKYGPKYSCFY